MINMPFITSSFWFNSKPLSGHDIFGKVVLIDFWTYSCINCQRTIPYLRMWHEKYKDMGLMIIGVHTPEFEFEKDPANVKRAIKELGVTWPVALDNDQLNWTNFANKYWPAKYLSDRSGHIVYNHFGEGAYAETEATIQNLLAEKEPFAEMPSVDDSEHLHGAVCFKATPETYIGYHRGRISNPVDFQDDKSYEYKRPVNIPKDSIALDGNFIAAAEYCESAGPASKLFLKFRASEVNLVLHPKDKEAVLEVQLNGLDIPPRLKGKDIGQKGELLLKEPRLFSLIKGNEIVEGELSVSALKGDFRAFAFTFSGCIYPEY